MLLVSETRLGGMGASVASQAAWFAANGWDVLIAAPDPQGPDDVAQHRDLAIPTTARAARDMLLAGRDLRRIIRSWRPTAIHAHGARAFAVALASCTGRPLVTLHGTGSDPTDPGGWSLVRSIGVAVAPIAARRAMSVAPTDRPGWAFTPHASPRLGELSESEVPDLPVPTFLWLAALDARKQPERFIDAISIASRTRPIRGIVAGTGSRSAAIEEQVRQTGAAVDIVGQVDNVAELIAGATAVVLLSHHEGVPFALEEAMWAGRTFVATPHPGVRWLGGEIARYASTAESAASTLLALAEPGVAQREGRLAAERVRLILRPDDPWPAVAGMIRER